MTPEPRCDVCDNTTWTRTDAGVAVRCECFAERLPSHGVDVPFEFHGASLENFRLVDANRDAVARATKAWADGRDLFLFGPVGTGKTRLACSYANEAQQGGSPARFVRSALLLLQLQWQQLAIEEGEVTGLFRSCMTVPVLVLDDVGTEKGSDFTRRTLQTLYDARGDRGIRTIWTSNLSLSELRTFLDDDRMPSRIAGRAAIVKLDGRDWRVAERRRADAGV
jgi:DNA replication protein DnaC